MEKNATGRRFFESVAEIAVSDASCSTTGGISGSMVVTAALPSSFLSVPKDALTSWSCKGNELL